jgi:hypothetical protein
MLGLDSTVIMMEYSNFNNSAVLMKRGKNIQRQAELFIIVTIR